MYRNSFQLLATVIVNVSHSPVLTALISLELFMVSSTRYCQKVTSSKFYSETMGSWSFQGWIKAGGWQFWTHCLICGVQDKVNPFGSMANKIWECCHFTFLNKIISCLCLLWWEDSLFQTAFKKTVLKTTARPNEIFEGAKILVPKGKEKKITRVYKRLWYLCLDVYLISCV